MKYVKFSDARKFVERFREERLECPQCGCHFSYNDYACMQVERRMEEELKKQAVPPAVAEAENIIASACQECLAAIPDRCRLAHLKLVRDLCPVCFIVDSVKHCLSCDLFSSEMQDRLRKELADLPWR